MEINGPCPRPGSGLGKAVSGLMDESGLGQEEKEASVVDLLGQEGPLPTALG